MRLCRGTNVQKQGTWCFLGINLIVMAPQHPIFTNVSQNDDIRKRKGDVIGILHFYKPPEDGSDPCFEVTDSSGAGRKNYGHNPKPVLIQDMRKKETQFSLDIHSFAAVCRHPPQTVDFTNATDIKGKYELDAATIILKHVPAAQKVVIFDSTIRRASPSETLCRPVRKVHIDQTRLGALRRVNLHLSGHEANEVAANRLRVRIVNVWRPIVKPVLDHPLAVGDSSTIQESDLVKVKHIYPESAGETYAVKYSPAQRFWYWSHMSPSDVLLLQCFDSLQNLDDTAQPSGVRCAHASFNPLAFGDERCRRQSIEVRCLVLG